MDELTSAELDKKHLWHPFTPMGDWCATDHEPLMLGEGHGCYLFDQNGRKYLDGNASIWTNIHGHNHPRINAAIRDQLDRVAHTSFLGFGSPPASQLALELVKLFPGQPLNKVFYSDNGSTAIEAALRMALQYWKQNGQPERDSILTFDAAYHGDTLGAASIGGIALFKGNTNQYGYKVDRVANMAAIKKIAPSRIAAVIIEPLMQGAAGMKTWPKGMLKELEAWCREHDIFLILDEVMTGFGRTGTMFACQQEEVIPDFICLAKGLTGGYLPLAVTMTTQRVFDGFIGDASEGNTLYYGHSYTGNQLGCAAALASLAVFREENVLAQLPEKMAHFSQQLLSLTEMSHVVEVRQCGLMAGIDLVANKNPRVEYPTEDRMGVKVCFDARRHGLLTRPVGNTLVLMPPLCVTNAQIDLMIEALRSSISLLCGE